MKEVEYLHTDEAKDTQPTRLVSVKESARDGSNEYEWNRIILFERQVHVTSQLQMENRSNNRQGDGSARG